MAFRRNIAGLCQLLRRVTCRHRGYECSDHPSLFIVGVAERKSDVPADNQLSLNYPNPFNPTTTIRYGLPLSARVTLKVYNVLGPEVSTLVDEEQSSAVHRAVWCGLNGTGVPGASGPYFYRLSARGLSQNRKMLLVR